jgi:hypothetical protein
MFFRRLFVIACLVLRVDLSTSYQPTTSQSSSPSTSSQSTRRAFLTISTAVLSTATTKQAAFAANVKVTAKAHTFLTSGGTVKPISDIDATTLFTNARVAYLFQGPDAISKNLVLEVLDLTVQRKAGTGPGVTLGKVEVLSSTKSFVDASTGMGLSAVSVNSDSLEKVVEFALGMPEGDVLLVGPILSRGTANDGKLVADTAAALELDVGGKREGGVISVLLDGPREGLVLEQGGYPVSDLLWYSRPTN